MKNELIEGLEQMHDETLTRAEQAESSLATVTAELERVRAALKEYGKHDTICLLNIRVSGSIPGYIFVPHCTCGLDAALSPGRTTP